MFSVLSKVTSYIWGSENKENQESTEPENSDIQNPSTVNCSNDTVDQESSGAVAAAASKGEEVKSTFGRITNILKGYGIVDYNVYFPLDMVLGGEMPMVGQTVHFTAKRTAEGGWRATSIKISECWEDVIDSKVGVEAKNEPYVSNDKSDAAVIGDESEKDELNIGIISGVNGSDVTINEKLTVDIKIFTEFYPVRGDWVNFQLFTNEKTGQTTVKNIQPLRQQTIDGNITFLRQSFGIINEEIYFLSSAIGKNYIPHRNDKVRVQAIESSQGHYNWRAIHIVPKSLGFHDHKTVCRPDHKPKVIFGSFVNELLRDKGGITITNPLDFGKINLNRRLFVTAWVRNCGSQPHVLISCCTPSQQKSVFFFDEPKPVEKPGSLSLSECCEDGIRMHPGGAVYVNIRCEASILGKFKQLIVFEFKGFKIGRHLTAEIQDVNQSAILPVAPFKHRSRNDSMKSIFTSIDSNSWVLPGEAPRRGPPKRIPISLPQYPVPNEFWKYIKENKELLDVIPSLAFPLNPENYATKFQALLHLEEMQMEIDMRSYDIAEITLQRRGDYLSIEVPGLAEGRPSLLIGDKVLLSNCENESTKFEGYIHEVQNVEIFLKFHSSFHTKYDGEAYSVAFQISRTTLRREHQAVTLVEALGQDVLFPQTTVLKEPQICFQERLFSCSHCQVRDGDDKQTPTIKFLQKLSMSQGSTNQGEIMNQRHCEQSDKPIILKETYSNNDLGLLNFKDLSVEGEEKSVIFRNSHISEKLNPEIKTGSILGEYNENAAIYRNQNSETITYLPPTPPNDKPRSRTSSCSSDSQSSSRSGRSPRQTVVERLFGVKSLIPTIPAPEEYEDEVPYNSPEKNFQRNKPHFENTSDEEDECMFSENITKLNYSYIVHPSFKSESEISESELKSTVKMAKNNSNSMKCIDDPNYVSQPSVNSEYRISDLALKKIVRTVTDNSVTTSFVKVPKESPKHANYQAPVNYPLTDSTSESPKNKLPLTPRNSPQVFNSSKERSKKSPRDNEGSYQRNAYHNKKKTFYNKNIRQTSELTVLNNHYQENFPMSSDKKILPSSKNSGIKGLPTSPRKSKKPFLKPSCYVNTSNPKMFGFIETKNNVLIKTENSPSISASASMYSPLKLKKEDTVDQCLCKCHGKQSLRRSPILDWQNKYLNERQKAAVRRILGGMCRPVPYVIFGPPGTGKTVTLVEAIIQVYQLLPYSRILACTPSNSAADLITERLHLSGLIKKGMMIRLNAFNRINEAVPEVIRQFCEDSLDVAVASRYRIIICTCTTAGLLYNAGIPKGHFTHVFIDEAGQATEPESLIPIILTGMEGQIILAGDPNQLDAMIRSPYAKAYGLGVSLLERLMQRPVYKRDESKFSDHGNYDPLFVTKLVHNYRSHPSLIAVPSELFYHKELEVCASESIRDMLCDWDTLPCKDFPFIMHGVQGKDLREGNSPSWFNPVEVMQVISYLQSLYSFGLKPNDIGIISPYRKQVEKIRMMLNSLDIDSPKVGSVEEFQGQERIAIIISTVRSEENYLNFDSTYNLGFLRNPKRFNVAITRAQSLLIIIGNPYILNQDPCWNSLLKYAVANGAYIGCDLTEIDLESILD